MPNNTKDNNKGNGGKDNGKDHPVTSSPTPGQNKVAPKESGKDAAPAGPKVAKTNVVVDIGAAGLSPAVNGAPSPKDTSPLKIANGGLNPMDALTNQNLYHSVSRSDRKLFHFHSAHKVRKNGDLYKFGYHHVHAFFSYPELLTSSLSIANDVLDVCNSLARKFTFRAATVPGAPVGKGKDVQKELILIHNPIRFALSQQSVAEEARELKVLFATIAKLDGLVAAYVADFQRTIEAHFVTDLASAVDALTILKNTIHTFRLRDPELRGLVLVKVAAVITALSAEVSIHPTPALLEAHHDVKVFDHILKEQGNATWQFLQTLLPVLEGVDHGSAKIRMAIVDLLQVIGNSFADTLFPGVESIALAVHTLGGTIPTNGASFFWHYRATFGVAFNSIWGLIRDFGSPALLAYMVVKEGNWFQL